MIKPLRLDRRWRRIGFGLLLLVGIGLAFFSLVDVQRFSRAFGAFALGRLWMILPIAFGALLVNAMRWHVLVARLDPGVPAWVSVVSYVAGQALVLAPGGFAFRKPLLDRALGRKVESGPALFVQEFLEMVSLVAYAGFGISIFWGGVPLLIGTLVLVIVIVVTVAHDGLSGMALNALARIQRLAGIERKLRAFRLETKRLLHWSSLAMALILSLVADLAGPVILILVWSGFGLEAPQLPQAAFVFAFSILAGMFSPLPGGLGVAEVSFTTLIRLVRGGTMADAAAISLVFRACTFLFSIAIGLVALALLYLLAALRRNSVALKSSLP